MFRAVTSTSRLWKCAFAGVAASGSAAAVLAATAQRGDAVNAYDIEIDGGNGKYPAVLPAYIEIPARNRVKYEYDHKLDRLCVDRVLASSIGYVAAYGFFPSTYADDGDPLDVLVLCDEHLEPGCVAEVRVLGHMLMVDGAKNDEKVLAVLNNDPRYQEYTRLRDVPEHILREIAEFCRTYKNLENKGSVQVGGWYQREDTFALIRQTHEAYLERKRKQQEAAAGAAAQSSTA